MIEKSNATNVLRLVSLYILSYIINRLIYICISLYCFQISTNYALFQTDVEIPAMRRCGMGDLRSCHFIYQIFEQMKSCDEFQDHLFVFLMPHSIENQWLKYDSQFKYNRKDFTYTKDLNTSMHFNLEKLYRLFNPWNRGLIQTSTQTTDMELF